jgi:hypothetical protein
MPCGSQRKRRPHERARLRERGRNRIRRNAAMVAEQAVAQALDRAALALRARLDGEIAFGVEPDRAIVEIGRAHMQEDIIDDHQLLECTITSMSFAPLLTCGERTATRSRTPAARSAAMKRLRPLPIAWDSSRSGAPAAR